ncbi:MAG TPA: 23S rRNA (adenine(2503)-C(2))-methyltransferase RlmN, partial [Tissierellaceae bacterium]|nr:23S rRNA (adenine(2503)-C(2))-methyltransferase RlmN [Tissierellaceae bacterium]
MLPDIELNSMTLEELKKLMTELGEQAFRGEQLFIYFNKNNGLDINEATTLPLKFREEIREKTTVKEIKILEKLESKLDDTVKYLFLLEDNNVIESVLMKYEHGYTICVSTQVGCRMGCRFCASTRGGKVRDLTASEMLNQVYMIEKDMNITINNIVLMGMGEPLDN